MSDLDRSFVTDSAVGMTTAVKYGRTALVALSLLLVIVVLLPNGSYRWNGAVARINAFASPFGDYGGSEIGGAALVALLAVLGRARHWRQYWRSTWGFVFVYAGILGLLLPDLWTRNRIFLPKGGTSRAVVLSEVYGFWLNLSLVAALLIIASVVIWKEPRLSLNVHARRADAPSSDSK